MADLIDLLRGDAAVRAAAVATQSRTFNVQAFNATGDGSTDDTAALDNALAALTAAGGGLFVMPPGRYRYNGKRFRFTTPNTYLLGIGATFAFEDTSTDGWLGRIAFDGGFSSGEIANVGVLGKGFTIFEVNQPPNQNTVANDPLGDHPYSSMRCSLALRGVADFLVDGGAYIKSPGWTMAVKRSRDGIIRDTIQRGAIADGIHLDYGCSSIEIRANHIYACGDDGIAIGYTGPACKDITIADNIIRDIGASGIKVYGAESGKTNNITIRGNDIDTTLAKGIGVTAAKYGGDPVSAPVAAAPIGTVRILGNTVRGYGMRDLSKYARAVGPSAGIVVEDYGSTIDAVEISGGSISDGRNNFVRVDGTVGRFVMRDVDMSNMAAVGGAGPVTGGGGGNNTAQPNNGALPVYLGALASPIVRGNTLNGSLYTQIPAEGGGAVTPTPSVIASDDFNRADAGPAVGAAGSTKVGSYPWQQTTQIVSGKLLLPGNYGSTFIEVDDDDFDVSVDVQVRAAGNPGRVCLNAANGSQLLLGTGGELFFYDNSDVSVHPINGNGFAARGVGTHTLRLVRAGNNVTAYINGAKVGEGAPNVAMPALTRPGMQNGGGSSDTANLPLYDNFSLAIPA